MAAESLVQARVTAEMKALVRELAEREQITGSALVRQLLEVMLRKSGAEGFPKLEALKKVTRDARPSVRSAPEDRILLCETAAARSMAVGDLGLRSGPVALRDLTLLPKEALSALKRSVAELGTIGRNLNQIARAAHHGGKPSGPGLLETRKEVERGWVVVGDILIAEDRGELANTVWRFAAEMPPPITDRELIARDLRNRVREGTRSKRSSSSVKIPMTVQTP